MRSFFCGLPGVDFLRLRPTGAEPKYSFGGWGDSVLSVPEITATASTVVRYCVKSVDIHVCY